MNNSYPQINIIFDRRKIATPTVKSSVEIRICHNYKQKFISTGIKLNSTQWKNGRIINCPDIVQLSQTKGSPKTPEVVFFLSSDLTEVLKPIVSSLQFLCLRCG